MQINNHIILIFYVLDECNLPNCWTGNNDFSFPSNWFKIRCDTQTSIRELHCYIEVNDVGIIFLCGKGCNKGEGDGRIILRNLVVFLRDDCIRSPEAYTAILTGSYHNQIVHNWCNSYACQCSWSVSLDPTYHFEGNQVED